MRLIITEKQQTAKQIANALGVVKSERYLYICDNYVVGWLNNPLLVLANPEEYNTDYNVWKLANLPIKIDTFKMMPHPKKTIIIKSLKKLFLDEKYNEIICATEPSREGQYVFDSFMEHIGCIKPVKRLWLKTLDTKTIQNELSNLSDNYDYLGYFYAGSARAKSDWLFGYNFSRLFSLLLNEGSENFTIHSVGRTQASVLNLIDEREKAVVLTPPPETYKVVCALEGFDAFFYSEEGHVFNKSEAEAIVKQLENERSALVVDIIKVPVVHEAPKLYYQTSLQRDASIKYGYSPRDVLAGTMGLYEKGLISYPKTSRDTVPKGMRDELIDMLGICEYAFDELEFAVNEVKQNSNVSRLIDVFDESEHHGIIITPDLYDTDVSKLPNLEYNLLTLIAGRVVVALSDDYRAYEVRAYLSIEQRKAALKYVSYELENAGWKNLSSVVYLPDLEYVQERQEYLDLDIGNYFPMKTWTIQTVLDDTLQSYTYASLLKDMEDISEDIHGEKSLFGTEATRSFILDDLLKKGYIFLDKNKFIHITSQGSDLISVLPEDIKSPHLTNSWENTLKQIRLRKYPSEAFEKDVEIMVEDIYAQFSKTKLFKEKSDLTFQYDAIDNANEKIICPACKNGFIKENKYTYYCSNKYTSTSCEFVVWKNDFILEKFGIALEKEQHFELIKVGEVIVEKDGTQYRVTLLKKQDKYKMSVSILEKEQKNGK